jgi:single-stranded DNA-binding protein
MLSVLMQGTLSATPMRRTSEAGRTFATAQVRVPTDDDALLCSVIVFDAAAVDALLALDKGDAVAVSGTAKLSHWTGKDGTERTGLSVTGQRVMTAYTATKKRRAQGEADELAERAFGLCPRDS